ncbi:MAG: NTP transferase domain-containing protein [Sideroxydans sp.]|nr:NTP transferase domain-containing protein [Sideroxydans sp.]
MSERILAMILAGGEGSRLHPLTFNHAKPSIVFGGYRLVDFVLSNLVNSGIESIYLLAQYKPESLIEHIHANWTLAPGNEECFVSVVVPRYEEGQYFCGTADAVYQNLELIEQHDPDLVAVFAADQVYRMDVRQMAAYHRECNAEVTVATTRVALEQAKAFGVIVTEGQGRIGNFQEKPECPVPIAFNSARACVSTGNYLFTPEVLVDSLDQALRHGETDFGKHLLPRLVDSHRVYAYDLAENKVPGVRPYEEEAYWRDIGTLEAYVDALQDVDGNMPRFNLHNSSWPIMPALSAQRPLFDAHYAQLVVAHKRRAAGDFSYTIVG